MLIDAQGYIDGIGPAANAPRFVSALGVQFLKTKFLREQANQMAYFDKAKYATHDAMLIGRLHTLRAGWLEAKVAFIQSGGFKDISKQVWHLCACGAVIGEHSDKDISIHVVQ